MGGPRAGSFTAKRAGVISAMGVLWGEERVGGEQAGVMLPKPFGESWNEMEGTHQDHRV